MLLQPLELLHYLFFMWVQMKSSFKIPLSLSVVFELQVRLSNSVDELYIVRLNFKDVVALLDTLRVLLQLEIAKR